MLLLLPFLPMIVAGVLASIGLYLNWHFGITDWKTGAIFVAALAAIAIVASTKSVWARFAIVGILAFAGYLKGHVDGVARIEAKYEAARQAEATRQTQANEEALKAAAIAKKKADEEAARNNALTERNNSEALSDPNANREALSAAAVERLNRLRRGQPRPEAPRPADPKGPASKPNATPAGNARVSAWGKDTGSHRSGNERRRELV